MLTLVASLILVQTLEVQGKSAAKAGAVSPHSSQTQSLSPDGNELAFHVDDGTLRFLALPEGKVRLSVPGLSKWIDDLAWSPDGKVVAAVGRDGGVRIIRATDGHVEAEFATSPEIVRPLARTRTIDFVDGGTKLLLAGGRSALQLRERLSGGLVAEFLLDSGVAISASCVSHDRSAFAAGDRTGCFAAYFAATGEIQGGSFRGLGEVHALAFDPERTRLAVGSDDCNVLIVPLRTGVPTATLSHCDEEMFCDLAIGCVDFSPDGKRLLATSFSFHEVRLWDLKTGSATWRYDYGGGSSYAIAARFAQDPSIVAVSRDGILLDAATGEVRHELMKHTEFGHCSAQGRYAWTTRDSRLNVYELRDGKLVAEVDWMEPAPR